MSKRIATKHDGTQSSRMINGDMAFEWHPVSLYKSKHRADLTRPLYESGNVLLAPHGQYFLTTHRTDGVNRIAVVGALGHATVGNSDRTYA